MALAELLRDCVRRHQRLPEMIVSDCGSDFQSVFYETTLAAHGVHKKDRPSAAPRFGGELERLFGTLKTSILWSRRGSTRNDARGRAVSASHRSDRLAEQDLIDFYHELEHAIFSQRNLHLRGERSNSPDLIAAAGLAMYPMSGIEVAYDYDFLVATSIDASDKTYRVDRARGVNPYVSYRFPKLTKSYIQARRVARDAAQEKSVESAMHALRTSGAWEQYRQGTLSRQKPLICEVSRLASVKITVARKVVAAYEREQQPGNHPGPQSGESLPSTS